MSLTAPNSGRSLAAAMIACLLALYTASVATADEPDMLVPVTDSKWYQNIVPSGRVGSGYDHGQFLIAEQLTHPGVDIGGGCRLAVYAADDGEVVKLVKTGDRDYGVPGKSGVGNAVVIKHADVGGKPIYTLYLHMAETPLVSEGMIERGKKIGLTGATGFAKGCHLHFEVRHFAGIRGLYNEDWRNIYGKGDKRHDPAFLAGWSDPETWMGGFEPPAPSAASVPSDNFGASEVLDSQARLLAQLKDGLYAMSSSACDLREEDVGDSWGLYFKSVEIPKFSVGYETTCRIQDVNESDGTLNISAACSGEGNVFYEDFLWRIISDETFTDLGHGNGARQFYYCRPAEERPVVSDKWTPNVVFNGEVPFGACRGEPMVPCLKRLGMNEETIRFIQASIHQDDPFTMQVPTDFFELGKVDLLQMSRFNAPWVSKVIINGHPEDFAPKAASLDLNSYPLRGGGADSLKHRFPQGTGWIWWVGGHRTLPTGGQRFVVETFYTTSCRACDVIGLALEFLEYDETGQQIGFQKVGILDTSQLSFPIRLTPNLMRQRPTLVQYVLNLRGYNAGEMDGAIGPQTKTAIAHFQKEQGINSGNGILDQATLVALADEKTFLYNGQRRSSKTIGQTDTTANEAVEGLTIENSGPDLFNIFLDLVGEHCAQTACLYFDRAERKCEPSCEIKGVSGTYSVEMISSADVSRLFSRISDQIAFYVQQGIPRGVDEDLDPNNIEEMEAYRVFRKGCKAEDCESLVVLVRDEFQGQVLDIRASITKPKSERNDTEIEQPIVPKPKAPDTILITNLADYLENGGNDALSALSRGVRLAFTPSQTSFMSGKILMHNSSVPTSAKEAVGNLNKSFSWQGWMDVTQGNNPTSRAIQITCQFDPNDPRLEREAFSVVNAKLLQYNDQSAIFACSTM